MSFEHELILPNEGFPFKIFLFEGSAGNYYREKHWHRSIEIFAVYQGEIDFLMDARTWHLMPGEFVLVNSNEVHAIDCPLPNETIVLQVPLRFFENYFTSEQFIWFAQDPKCPDAHIMKLVRDIYDTWIQGEETPGYDMRMNACFYAVMYELILSYRVQEVNPDHLRKNRNLNRLSAITDYMKENYTDDLTLEEVARIFGYSPTYLSRMFQKYAGITFKNYLQSVRLDHAVKDLMRGFGVTQTAVRNGFSGSKTFARAFEKKYGMLPSTYQKQHVQSGNKT